jgi:hypothetical protein
MRATVPRIPFVEFVRVRFTNQPLIPPLHSRARILVADELNLVLRQFTIASLGMDLKDASLFTVAAAVVPTPALALPVISYEGLIHTLNATISEICA